MKQIIDGESTVYLYADDEKEIVDGVTFLKNFGINKIVIVGASESRNQLDFIKENNVPVVVKQPYRFPQSIDSDPSDTFKLAKLMLDKGILVSIDPSGAPQSRVSVRNLPFMQEVFQAMALTKRKLLV